MFFDVVKFIDHFPDNDINAGGILSNDIDVIAVMSVQSKECLQVFTEVFVVTRREVLPCFINDDGGIIDGFENIVMFPFVSGVSDFFVKNREVGIDTKCRLFGLFVEFFPPDFESEMCCKIGLSVSRRSYN